VAAGGVAKPQTSNLVAEQAKAAQRTEEAHGSVAFCSFCFASAEVEAYVTACERNVAAAQWCGLHGGTFLHGYADVVGRMKEMVGTG